MQAQAKLFLAAFGLLLLAACGGNTTSKSVVGPQSATLEAGDGRDLLLQMPFAAGVSHVSGRYGFTADNYLVEGAQRISSLGSDSIFVYLTPSFRSSYPDKNAGAWPAADPSNLADLARTAPYRALFQMPFRTFVVTMFTFSNYDNIAAFATTPQAAVAEENETYDLARYLLTTYAGTGKIFILKNWEGDYAALQGFDTSLNISPVMVTAMINWMSARQRGIARARHDAGDPAGVGVFHAVEVNRIFDYSRQGLTRLINAVVPFVGADLVSYSSYDSTLAGSDAPSTAAAINEALDVIYHLAPDPLNLGSRRLLLSEYGLFENERPAELAWRPQTILQTAKSANALGAFLWEVYDNECKDVYGNYFPVDSSPGNSLRPANSQCRGLWLVKPDGTQSPMIAVLTPYWQR